MNNNICTVKGVCKRYSEEVLRDISFEIRKGETLGIIGESGAGKSTLGRMLVGLEFPDKGEICYRGCDLRKRDALNKYRTKIQMVFQDAYSSLNPKKTVREMIVSPLKYHNLVEKGEEEKRVLELINMAELPKKYLDRYPSELSGGQRQRVSIAKALSLNPEMIVWDEPISALDKVVAVQILDLMIKLKRENNITNVFIGHGIGEIAAVSDRILVIKDGNMVEIGDTIDIIKNPKKDYTKDLIRGARY